MNESGWDLTHSILDPELLEAPETSLKLRITGTSNSSSCFDVGLGSTTGIFFDLLITCHVVYMLLDQLVEVSGSRASCFCRGSHGRVSEHCPEKKEGSYVAHLAVEPGRRDSKTEQSSAGRGSQQEVI